MRRRELGYIQLSVAMASSGAAQVGLVCTPGDVFGPAYCEESMSASARSPRLVTG